MNARYHRPEGISAQMLLESVVRRQMSSGILDWCQFVSTAKSNHHVQGRSVLVSKWIRRTRIGNEWWSLIVGLVECSKKEQEWLSVSILLSTGSRVLFSVISVENETSCEVKSGIGSKIYKRDKFDMIHSSWENDNGDHDCKTRLRRADVSLVFFLVSSEGLSLVNYFHFFKSTVSYEM